jgi:hypothetical protein
LQTGVLTDLARIAVDGVDSAIFVKANEYASNTRDLQLGLQIAYCRHFYVVSVAAARAEEVIRSDLGGSIKERRITAKQVQLVKDLRAKTSAFKVFAEARGDVFGVAAVGEQPDLFHVEALHGMFDIDYKAVQDSVLVECFAILQCYGNSWTNDIAELKLIINSSFPVWEHCRETLCTCPDLVLALTSNPDYPSIGPLCNQLREMLKLVKFVTNDSLGFMVDPNMMKGGASVVDLGVETVAFTYLLTSTTVHWKTITSVLKAQEAVNHLRSEIGKCKVKLTEQMEGILCDWEEGRMLPSALEALSASVDVPGLHAGESNPAVVAPATPSTQLVDNAAATPLVVPGRKLAVSLADRMKQAKKQKLS